MHAQMQVRRSNPGQVVVCFWWVEQLGLWEDACLAVALDADQLWMVPVGGGSALVELWMVDGASAPVPVDGASAPLDWGWCQCSC
jgi:hypothetical protein